MNCLDVKSIGIIGGMGPHSGMILYQHVLANTKASSDQDHLPVMIMSFPEMIVDRTAFLFGEEKVNPALNILKMIRQMHAMGTEIFGMACNTVHAPKIYNLIEEGAMKISKNIKLLNMPLETCHYLHNQLPKAKKIGLMTTNGTYKAKIYSDSLKESGFDVVVPEFQFQNEVIHKMIYDPNFGIKAKPDCIDDRVYNLMDKSMRFFKNKNVDTVIFGCTELPLAYEKRVYNGIKIIDPMEVLAKAMVKTYESIEVNYA